MKRYLYFILMVLLACGCSSDGDDNETLPTGQYVARSGSVVLSTELANGNFLRLTAFKDNSVVSQCSNVATTGQYPNLTYSGSGFTLSCKFANTGQFSATLSGNLPTLYTDKPIDLSGTYQFSRYDGVLDANGDGILDNSQNQ